MAHTDNAITIQNLHYAYPPLTPEGLPVQVLRGINLVVAPGEFLSIMGPTGVGKSTLCMAMGGLVPQSTGGIIKGQVTVLGRDPRAIPVAELAAQVGTVYQDPESQLFSTTVADEVAFGPENLGIAPQEIAERVDWALDLVHMRAHKGRSPTHLSGGQKQRVAIAASLSMLPKLLILDEPTTNLDPVGRAEVFEVIEQLCRERRMTIIMVSHDAEHVAEFSDRVAVMWQGQIACVGSPESVFQNDDLIRQTGIHTPQVSSLALTLRPELAGRHFISLDVAEEALRSIWPGPAPSLRHASETTKAPSTGIPSAPSEDSDLPAVRIAGLSYHYGTADLDTGVEALNGVDLVIRENAYLGIVGQNGSGKTTLVKHLNGLLKPNAGDVWVWGTNTRTARVSDLARSVGLVFQNPDHQIFCPTTEDEIRFGPLNLGLGPDETRIRTDEALQLFGLIPHAKTPPALLGFGLRRLVSIAAVYAMRPRLLVLDEPTAGLDQKSAQDLMALVDDLHGTGHTIVLVSHDLSLIAEHTHETLVMHEGRVLAHGPTRQVMARAGDLAAAQIRLPQIMRLAHRLADLGFPRELLSVDEFAQTYRSLASSPARGGSPAST